MGIRLAYVKGIYAGCKEMRPDRFDTWLTVDDRGLYCHHTTKGDDR